MGILNVTPDSFYQPSRKSGNEIAAAAESLVAQGADIIDIGAYSSRPGADEVSAEEEMDRLGNALRQVKEICGKVLVSVDTFRAEVAEKAVVEYGADIINDISGGLLDERMIQTVATLKVPYVLMHMRGTPATMQEMCDYPEGVTAGVIKELSERINAAALAGIADIIVDPGFGFAKTVEQNYELLRNLPLLADAFRRPVLVGMSRKSMFTRPMVISPGEALPATVAANTIAVMEGAAIIRVHDVAAAIQCVEVCRMAALASK